MTYWGFPSLCDTLSLPLRIASAQWAIPMTAIPKVRGRVRMFGLDSNYLKLQRKQIMCRSIQIRPHPLPPLVPLAPRPPNPGRPAHWAPSANLCRDELQEVAKDLRRVRNELNDIEETSIQLRVMLSQMTDKLEMVHTYLLSVAPPPPIGLGAPSLGPVPVTPPPTQRPGPY